MRGGYYFHGYGGLDGRSRYGYLWGRVPGYLLIFGSDLGFHNNRERGNGLSIRCFARYKNKPTLVFF